MHSLTPTIASLVQDKSAINESAIAVLLLPPMLRMPLIVVAVAQVARSKGDTLVQDYDVLFFPVHLSVVLLLV